MLRSGYLVAATLAASLVGMQALGADFPSAPPGDPRLAEAYVQVQALYHRAQQPGYLDMPSGAWPCAAPELELRRLSDALGFAEQSDEERRAIEVYERRKGEGSRTRIVISDVKLVPITAKCVDGQLDGPLEFAMEFTSTADMPTAVHVSRKRVRGQLVMAGGAVSQAPRQRAERELSSELRFKDARQEAQRRQANLPPTRTHSYIVSVPTGTQEELSASIMDIRIGNQSPSILTQFATPTGPRRQSMETYRDGKRFMAFHTKNYLHHGEFRILPHTVDGIAFPGSVKCFEDGEEIKTETCDVD